MIKKVLYNTSSQVLGKIVTASTTFLITILIARSLGESGFGDFTKIFVFVGYFYTVVDFGLNSIYIKFAKDDSIYYLKLLLGLRIILSLTLVALANVISFAIPYNAAANTGFPPIVKTAILIASLTIITQALLSTANAYFQKILRYDYSTIALTCGSIVVFLGILLTLSSKNLLVYTTIYVAQGITFSTVAFYLIWRKSKSLILPEFDLKKAKALIKDAWPIGIALILNLIYFRFDVFILSNTRSSQEVGIYGLAYQFFEAALTLPIFFANSLYPVLHNLFAENRNQFRSQVKLWTKLLVFFSVLLTITLAVSSNLIPLIYNGAFKSSVPTLQILALGLPFFFISALLWQLFIIYGKQQKLILVYLAGAIANIVTNLIFIPQYGYLAAAITTVSSEALVVLLLLFYLKVAQKEIQT